MQLFKKMNSTQLQCSPKQTAIMLNIKIKFSFENYSFDSQLRQGFYFLLVVACLMILHIYHNQICLFAIMQLLTTFTGFFRSRQKLLIKRRKIALKNRPISSKRLKEQRQQVNISYETKLVEIKKQLDRKKSQNHHLNQIIEELFYPEMKLQDQKQIEMRVKQMSSDSPLLGDNWEEELTADDLTQQIKSNNLPVDLLSIHEQRWQEFTQKHYEALMGRMNYYCFNSEKIKKKMMDNWERLIKKMQQKQGKNKPIKCPYLFLEREQITRHELWNGMIKELTRKMNEAADIITFNQYIPTLFQIQRTFNIVPAQIYVLLLRKNALANFAELTPQHISSLLKFLKYKNKIKYDPHIRISPEKQQQQASISHFARKLATEVINHPQNYTSEDFINIFIVVNSNKKKFSILTQQLLNKSQNIAASILNQLPFDKVLTYISVYAMFSSKPNIQFLQIMKFDLYRKCDSQQNFFPLLLLITRIQERKLIFRNYGSPNLNEPHIELDGYDLLLKATQAISKLISKLKAAQLMSLLSACFNNNLYRHSSIEIISTQFVKKGKEYDLQNLAKGLFRITLLGHRSKILAKYVFENYVNQYHEQVKKYKQEENLLLPTQGNISAAPASNAKVIHLQECLMITIWGVLHNLGQNIKNSISLDDLLTLIPVQLQSSDQLAIQLASQINAQLKTHSFFPKIQTVPNSMASQNRLKEFYRQFQYMNKPKNQQQKVPQKASSTKLYDLFL